MCGVQLKDRKGSTYLMFMLICCSCEAMDQLAMAKGVLWYGHVLRREDVPVLRSAIDFEVEGQTKKGRLKRTWKKQFEK